MRRLEIALLALAVFSLLGLTGCSGYVGMVFRENMLKPTPYMKVADKPQPKTWPSNAVTATWIGHATVLINFHGVTILTDPVLGKRLAPPQLFGRNFGIRRITEPTVRPEDLPPIDVVLLSHAHYDHWDRASLKRFEAPTHAVIPLATRDLLPRGRFGEVSELGWGQCVRVKGLTITAVPALHWGQRGRDPTPRGYNGYLIDGGGMRIYFAGDSAFSTGPDAPQWRHNVGDQDVDLCLLPIGDSYYHGNHMSSEEAWLLFRLLGGRQLMPIHWRTFIQSPPDQEPTFSPIKRLRAAAGDEQFRIVGAEPGQVVTVGVDW
jgi:L-ascorbate metabolism protein UlaG (beta-lactamase superfamily)